MSYQGTMPLDPELRDEIADIIAAKHGIPEDTAFSVFEGLSAPCQAAILVGALLSLGRVWWRGEHEPAASSPLPAAGSQR